MTRSLVDANRIVRLMEGMGRRARGPGRVYLVGGATAVLIGWRGATVDADLKLDPEPPAGAREAGMQTVHVTSTEVAETFLDGVLAAT